MFSRQSILLLVGILIISGFEIVEIRKDEIKRSRKIKPEIPLFDENGIEIRDEIEMEYIWK